MDCFLPCSRQMEIRNAVVRLVFCFRDYIVVYALRQFMYRYQDKVSGKPPIMKMSFLKLFIVWLEGIQFSVSSALSQIKRKQRLKLFVLACPSTKLLRQLVEFE
jgi:hypothetical protein